MLVCIWELLVTLTHNEKAWPTLQAFSVCHEISASRGGGQAETQRERKTEVFISSTGCGYAMPIEEMAQIIFFSFLL